MEISCRNYILRITTVKMESVILENGIRYFIKQKMWEPVKGVLVDVIHPPVRPSDAFFSLSL